MARVCTICSHEQQSSIEAALLDGLPETSISAQYGVSRSALARHRKNHLSPALWRALERREDLSAEALIGRLDALAMRLGSYEARAARGEDWQAVRGFSGELRKLCELIARLRGDLEGGGVMIDARRQQMVMIDKLGEGDLRSLAAAAEQGRLGEAAERAGLPAESVARLQLVPDVVEG
ncbi:MAG: hypothetical protein ACRDPP_00050 [Gaiellaceae bacterium]